MVRYAVITGCSKSSIGYIAARVLAGPTYDFKVILACRDEQKGKEAESSIISESPESKVTFVKLDLASFSSIRNFVTELRELDDNAIEKQGLDILVNNAGIARGSTAPYCETEDGLEEIVGVNHFGHFLLTNLLLDDIKRAEKSRIVVVSSGLHDPNTRKKEGEADQLLLPSFPDGILQTSDKYDGMLAYRVSKLCNLWFAYELQRLLRDTSVAVNAVSPGFIPATGLARRSDGFTWFVLQYVFEPLRYLGLLSFVRSPEDGGKAIVEACVGSVAGEGGQYLSLPKGAETLEGQKSSAESYDENKAAELWKMSMRVCKLE